VKKSNQKLPFWEGAAFWLSILRENRKINKSVQIELQKHRAYIEKERAQREAK
jgi:hypothetical protein